MTDTDTTARTTPAALYGPTYPATDSHTWAVHTSRPCVCGNPATELAPSRLEVGMAEPDPRGRYRTGDWIGLCAPCGQVVRSAIQTLGSILP